MASVDPNLVMQYLPLNTRIIPTAFGGFRYAPSTLQYAIASTIMEFDRPATLEFSGGVRFVRK